jgi:hypothetical protein
MMARNFRRSGQASPGQAMPARPLRRSQMISPFGVGAISDFRQDEALMCAGLDEWFVGQEIPDHLRLEEPRLQRRLGKAFFVRPPEHKGQDGRPRRIPFVRFPRWHYCPQCTRMSKAGLFSGDRPWCDPCTGGRRRRMIPVRIVAACEHGHIEDFPFRRWINCQCGSDDVAALRFRAGQSSAGLAGIQVSCDGCGRKRSLAGAMQPEVLKVVCGGGRPWLGQDAVACTEPLKGVQRGGSNVYFSLVVSSIFIPDKLSDADERVRNALEKYWVTLSSSLPDGKLDPVRIDFVAEQAMVPADRLAELGAQKLSGDPVSALTDEETFRQQEYALLRRSHTNTQIELVSDWVEGDAYGPLSPWIDGVGLVHRLRETRVLAGFSRLKPRSEGAPGIQPLSLAGGVNWLPALDVYGEGIFLAFRHDKLAAWADNPAVKARLTHPIEAYDQVRASRGEPPSGANARQMFLHTFAHAFMKELSYTCGYGSSSLRERLYVDVAHPDHPMAGVLIYTAAGDADGTLGGLVAQAAPERLPLIITEALRRSAWCSNDPVCLEGGGSGADTGSGAACHSCALVAETSCENGNRLLDRALLAGTPEQPEIGFLASLAPGYVEAV